MDAQNSFMSSWHSDTLKPYFTSKWLCDVWHNNDIMVASYVHWDITQRSLPYFGEKLKFCLQKAMPFRLLLHGKYLSHMRRSAGSRLWSCTQRIINMRLHIGRESLVAESWLGAELRLLSVEMHFLCMSKLRWRQSKLTRVRHSLE